MLAFCGQDRCLMDSNGRIKLAQHFIDDFITRCGGEFVMHGLPEKAIALYPEDVYAAMRKQELEAIELAASSFVARRSMRRFGALTRPDRLTRQGRVTVPAPFREFAELAPGAEVCVIGVEIGIEIWNPARYLSEMTEIQEHLQAKSHREMADDLARNNNQNQLK